MSSTESANILLQYRLLMSPAAWKQFRRGLVFGVVNGALHGASLMVLVPLITSLTTGELSYGLAFTSWLVLLAILAVGAAIADFVGTRQAYVGALGLLEEVYDGLGAKVSSLPLGWFRRDTPATLSRMASQEMMSVTEFAAHFFYVLIVQISSGIVILAGAWLIDWRLGLMLLISVPLLVLFLWLARRSLNHGRCMHEPTEDNVAGRIVEFTRCQPALRCCDRGADYAELQSALDANDRIGRRSMWWEALGQVLSGAMVQSIVVTIVVMTGIFLVQGSLQPVVGIAMIGVALRFHAILIAIASSLTGLEERRTQIDKINQVLASTTMPVPPASQEITAPGSVDIRNVDFGYHPNRPVLNAVSFSVPEHSMCAIVGPSGCGKTTLLRLMARFYDVSSGSVCVGGVDVRNLTTEDLMSQLSMVFQDVYLFDDTLEANIRMGDPSASEEEVRAAASLAGVDEIVARLPQGWQSTVGEGGRALSGGERQRISIARALLKKAPIVLFDEATSALDAENEANIVAAMQQLREQSTLIVVAHKLETINMADTIVVLDSTGHIVQRGSHDELIDMPGQYQQFWNARKDAAGWSITATS